MTYEELIERHNASQPRRNPRHEESRLQRQCVTWFRVQYPDRVLFAIPNGGKRNAKEAAIMKGEGVTAGVADLFLMHAAKGCNGLFIEMKYGDGVQQDTQKDFQRKATRESYRYVVCNSIEGFMLEVNNYLRK